MAIPKPPAEPSRVESLRALGGPQISEEHFTVITRLVSRVLEMPIAYISLVDETAQWIKASQGWCPAEHMPRRDSFCAHTVAAGRPVIVEDTWNDSRFASSPLVRGEPYARFYAGFPLAGPGGHAVGSLCVMDRKPRRLSPRQIAIMQDFVAQADRELGMAGVIHSQTRTLELQEELLSSQEQLNQELQEAVRYVESLLPRPVKAGDFRADWLYEPSSELGGDAFFYRQTGREIRMGIFDVSGHGVGAALLSVSLLNLGRNRAVNFGDRPDSMQIQELMREMAVTFPMDHNRGMYFTVWLGSFNLDTRLLTYSAAGHPPPIAFASHPDWQSGREIGMQQFPIGFEPEFPYVEKTIVLPPDVTLFLFSDGTYEIEDAAGKELELEWFYQRLQKCHEESEPLDRFLAGLRAKTGRVAFDDDVTLVRLRF